MEKYIKQDCSLTLKEGLDEYYASNSPAIKQYADKYGDFLVNHDLTHVIFGLGTSLEEETMLDTWTLRGTDITWKQIYQYTFDSNIKELTKIIVKDAGGWSHLFMVIFKVMPLKLKIHFNRIPKMKKKWPFSAITNQMLITPLNELRKEFGIEVISK